MKQIALLFVIIVSSLQSVPPETYLTFTDYCKFFNYPVEVHKIRTQDDYILTFYRIQAKGSQIQSNLKPVYLQHGVLDSSDTFIVNREEMSPAFIIANQGYDVWLGNSRGNKYSRTHVTKSADSIDFWDFSWQQMSEFDLPAAFNYIVQNTGFEKIDYVAHSQGTLIMFTALSQNNPTIKSHLGKFIAMGPVFYLKNQQSQLISTFSSLYEWENTLMNLGIYELLPSNDVTSHIQAVTCQYVPSICKFGLYVISDMKPELDNEDRLPVVMAHYPSGCSLYNMAHFAQMAAYKEYKLQKLDYLSDKANKQHYNTTQPPLYDPSTIEGDIYMKMVGIYDKLADVQDADLLRQKLLAKNPGLFYKTYEAGHATFIWGQNLVIMKDIIEILEK